MSGSTRARRRPAKPRRRAAPASRRCSCARCSPTLPPGRARARRRLRAGLVDLRRAAGPGRSPASTSAPARTGRARAAAAAGSAPTWRGCRFAPARFDASPSPLRARARHRARGLRRRAGARARAGRPLYLSVPRAAAFDDRLLPLRRLLRQVRARASSASASSTSSASPARGPRAASARRGLALDRLRARAGRLLVDERPAHEAAAGGFIDALGGINRALGARPLRRRELRLPLPPRSGDASACATVTHVCRQLRRALRADAARAAAGAWTCPFCGQANGLFVAPGARAAARNEQAPAVKVLHAPAEIAAQASILARALRDLGIEAHCARLQRGVPGLPDRRVACRYDDMPPLPRLRRLPVDRRAVHRALRRVSLPLRTHARPAAQPRPAALPRARRRSSCSTTTAATCATARMMLATAPALATCAECDPFCIPAAAAARAAQSARYADAEFVSTPDLLEIGRRGAPSGRARRRPGWATSRRAARCRRAPRRVLHAPTNRYQGHALRRAGVRARCGRSSRGVEFRLRREAGVGDVARRDGGVPTWWWTSCSWAGTAWWPSRRWRWASRSLGVHPPRLRAARPARSTLPLVALHEGRRSRRRGARPGRPTRGAPRARWASAGRGLRGAAARRAGVIAARLGATYTHALAGGGARCASTLKQAHRRIARLRARPGRAAAGVQLAAGAGAHARASPPRRTASSTWSGSSTRCAGAARGRAAWTRALARFFYEQPDREARMRMVSSSLAVPAASTWRRGGARAVRARRAARRRACSAATLRASTCASAPRRCRSPLFVLFAERRAARARSSRGSSSRSTWRRRCSSSAGCRCWFVLGMRASASPACSTASCSATRSPRLVGLVLLRHTLRAAASTAPCCGACCAYGAPLVPVAFAYAVISSADRWALRALRVARARSGVYARGGQVLRRGDAWRSRRSSWRSGPFAFARAPAIPTRPQLYARVLALYVAVASLLALAVGLFAPEALAAARARRTTRGAAGPALLLAFAAVAHGAYYIVGARHRACRCGRDLLAGPSLPARALVAVAADAALVPPARRDRAWPPARLTASCCRRCAPTRVAQRVHPLPFRGRARLAALFARRRSALARSAAQRSAAGVAAHRGRWLAGAALRGLFACVGWRSSPAGWRRRGGPRAGRRGRARRLPEGRRGHVRHRGASIATARRAGDRGRLRAMAIGCRGAGPDDEGFVLVDPRRRRARLAGGPDTPRRRVPSRAAATRRGAARRRAAAAGASSARAGVPPPLDPRPVARRPPADVRRRRGASGSSTTARSTTTSSCAQELGRARHARSAAAATPR